MTSQPPLFAGARIDPEHQKAFDWTFTDTPDRCTVQFSFPATFNLKCVKCDLFENRQLCVCYPNSPPLLSGVLFDVARSATLDTDDSSLTVTVTISKSSPGEWRLPICDMGCDRVCIDPKSAHLLFQALVGRPESLQNAVNFLMMSAQFRYPPAMYRLAVIHLVDGMTADVMEMSMKLLLEASQHYGHLPSTSYLLFATARLDRNAAPNAIQQLRSLAEQGVPEAILHLGQIHSTSMRIQHLDADPKEAVRLLEQCLAIPNLDPDLDTNASIELARLYYTGDAGERDEQRARQLYARAQEAARNGGLTIGTFEELCRKEDSGKWEWLLVGIGTAVVVGFVCALLRHVWRR